MRFFGTIRLRTVRDRLEESASGFGKLTAVDIETGKTVWDVRMRSPVMSVAIAAR